MLDAIKDVEDSCEKSFTQKVRIWISLFWSNFLFPSGIMSFDMVLDMFLVAGYACYLGLDDDHVNSTNAFNFCTVSQNESSSNPFLNIPQELNGKPRFFYSLSFIVFPWMFYCLEFCHTRHCVKTTKQVIICNNMFSYTSLL